MTTLNPTDRHLVLINTFTVEPSKADDLLEALSRATKDIMSHRPGFISANLHISPDRKHIANYAQWRSKDDLDAMMKDPTAQAHMKESAALAISFSPIYYELRETHAAQ
jgi:quinol monooxygenase YgiN